MDDSALLHQFESHTLPFEQWSHRMHLRVAYLYLRRDPFEEALSQLRSGIQAYNRVHRVPDSLTSGYHETLTVAWLRIIAARIHEAPDLDSASFCSANPDLLDKTLIRRFYSAERILSRRAKREFVPPDIEGLPGVVAA